MFSRTPLSTTKQILIPHNVPITVPNLNKKYNYVHVNCLPKAKEQFSLSRLTGQTP